MSETPLASVRNLSVAFRGRGGWQTAVDGIDLDIGRGRIVGLVGESGSGKSVTMLALARLTTTPKAAITADALAFDGRDVLAMGRRELRRLRGGEIGFVFQNPHHSLNPLLTVGRQLSEAMVAHMGLSQRAARERAAELLARVGIPDPRRRLEDYPHQFSGGMLQRAMIAMAIACEPRLILADEPTTALDVTIQAQILELLAGIVAETGASILIVTHDLGVAARLCDHVHVMYAGEIVEEAPVDALFYEARMPYTWGLLDSIIPFDAATPDRLPFIPGRPPGLSEIPEHCRFQPRCTHARGVCSAGTPALAPRSGGHLARCFGTEPDGWLERAR